MSKSLLIKGWLVTALAVFFLTVPKLSSKAEPTAFNYQGRLAENGRPANGIYDFIFSLYSTNTSGIPISAFLITNTLSVSNGLFSTTLDFGRVFNGTAYWMETAIRTNQIGDFIILSPRTQVNPVPYAEHADSATVLIGTVAEDQLSNNIPRLNNSTNTYTGVVAASGFAGDGSALTNLSWSAITDLQLPINAARLDATNSAFTGIVAAQKFVGDGSGLTNLPVVRVSDAQLSTNVILSTNTNVAFPGVVSAAQIIGDGSGLTNLPSAPVADGQLSSNVPLLGNSTNDFSGTLAAKTFVGDGSQLTNLPAVPIFDIQLSTNVAFVNSSNNTFLGAVIATGFQGDGSALTNLHIPSIEDAKLSTNIPRLDASNSTFLGNVIASQFTGNGSGLTNLPACFISDSQLSTNVALLNQSSNNFIGAIAASTFFGDASGLTNLPTVAISDTQLSGNVARLDATNASFAGTVAARQFVGDGAGITNLPTQLVNDSQLSTNVPLLSSSNTAFAGTLTAPLFVGDGSGLTNLPALAVSDGQLSTNVVLLNGSNTPFRGQVSAVTFQGDGSQITNIPASAITSGKLNSARLGSGTANSSTFLRGDGTWMAPGAGNGLQAVNNLADVANKSASGQNVGVLDIAADSGISGPEFAWTNATAKFANQLGIVRNGGAVAPYVSKSTAKGDWFANWMFNGAVQVGSQYWMSNYFPTGPAFTVWGNGKAGLIGTNGSAAGAEQTMLVEQPDPRQATYINFSAPSGWNGDSGTPIMGNPVDFQIGIGGFLYGTNTLSGVAIGRDSMWTLNPPVNLHFTTTENSAPYGCRAFLSYDNNNGVWHFPVDRPGNGAFGNAGYQDVLTIDTKTKTISSTNAVVKFVQPMMLGANSAPNSNAVLELSSTNKVLLLPRMTKAQRDAISTPPAGGMIYQTDNTPGLRVYNGVNWVRYNETVD